MKKISILIGISLVLTGLFACANEVSETIEIATEEPLITATEVVESNEELSEVTKLAKAFYEEYFAQEDENQEFFGRMGNAERMEVVKRKYLTENLIEELHLRSRQHNCDAITNSQDNTAIRDRLVFKNGKDENTANVIYRYDYDNGGFNQDIIELHFIDTDEGKRANALNVYHEDKDATGNGLKYEIITKYAIHDEFTEEDIKEMESIKKELDDLESQGFIG